MKGIEMMDRSPYRFYWFLILILLCLVGCTPATDSATQAPSETPLQATDTPQEFYIEPSPTPTILEQVDEEAPLSAFGPWLVYLTQEGIVVVNADGTGRTLLGPPPLKSVVSMTFDIPNGLSPRGNVFAFRGERADSSGLDLILARLPDGPISALTPLISFELENQEDIDIDIDSAVFWEKDALRWSPDGRYLAFVAALDGPSSDLYVFDTVDATIRRLTTGENQAATPVWTQDGRWIIHQEVVTFGSGAGWTVNTIWAAAVDGSSVRRLYDVPEYTGPEQLLGTTQTGELIVSRFSQNEPTLHVVDIDSVEITILHEGFPTADIVDFDPVSGAVAYITDGLYLRGQGSSSADLLAEGLWYNVRWSPGFDRFFAAGDAGVIAFSTSGEMEQITAEGGRPVPSPDGSWLVVSTDDLQLYDKEWNLVKQLPEISYSEGLWRPDSRGLFFVQGQVLKYLTIPEGATLLVEPKVMLSYDFPSYQLRNMGWVDNQDITLSGIWLFESEAGGLKLVDMESGQAVVALDELSAFGGDRIKVQQGRVYYFGGTDVGLVEVLMDGQMRETGIDTSRIIHPNFACLTPDGTRMIWYRYPEDWSLGEFEILESNLDDGSTTPLVTLQAPAELQEMVSMGGVYPNLAFLSPDERYLYYGWHFEGGGLIYVSGSLFSLSRVDLETFLTHTYVPLTEEIYGKIDAALSADGRTLAYLRPKDMTWDLVVQDTTSGNEVVYRLPAETVGAGRFFFSPDGSELALTVAQRDNQILYTEVLVFDLGSGQRRSIYMGFEDDNVKPFLETRAWTQEGWIVLGEGYRITGAGTWIIRPDGSGLMCVSESEFLAEVGAFME